MNQNTAHHELGQFIVSFQHTEAALTELLVLMAKADDEAIRILINELSYSQRLRTTDVMFARFVNLLNKSEQTAKVDFHRLMNELAKLGERRNEIVHSMYHPWINVEGKSGLLRQNSKLRGAAGTREEKEEELLPDAFSEDLRRLSAAQGELEKFRIRIINWLYPNDSA